MKIEYNNLYTHFIFTTMNRNRLFWISTGKELKNILPVSLIIIGLICIQFMLILNIFIFWYPVPQNCLKKILQLSLQRAPNALSIKITFAATSLDGKILLQHFLYPNLMLTRFVNIYSINPSIIAKYRLQKSMKCL